MRSSVLKLGAFIFILALIIFGAKTIVTTPFFSDTETSENNKITVAERFCEIKKVWAAGVESVSQGTLKNGGAITDPNRTNPNKALGPNDWVPGTGTNFFSLGKGGTTTLSFSSPVLDGEGDDLSFHEATNGRATYPEEKVSVEVSKDETTWYSIGEATSEPGGDGIVLLDFSSIGLSSVKFVRLTETTNFDPHLGNADGYDLDAVDAVYGCE